MLPVKIFFGHGLYRSWCFARFCKKPTILKDFYNNTGLVLSPDKSFDNKVIWRAPSNIALIKYWGKKEGQLPCNPSLSLTLSTAATTTSVSYNNKTNQKNRFEFFFKNKKNSVFEKKITAFFAEIDEIFPFLKQLNLKIHSENSFPHSAGIASSASAMAALALCLCDIERNIFNTPYDDDHFFRKASFVARIGSGSASRSVISGAALWGELEGYMDSSDYYAVQYKLLKPFDTLHDDIIIVSDSEKSVSSSEGHALMNDHPFAEARYAQAGKNIFDLIESMNNGDLFRFGEIIESEALTLHALMMCSSPSYILLKEDTLAIINLIREFRKKKTLPLFFTLDAGPNVHLIYPDEIREEAKSFIHKHILPLSVGNKVIEDRVGKMPAKLL